MSAEAAAGMRATETTGGVCERCDQETSRLTRWLDPDGTEHYVCWSCSQRREKRVNLSGTWKRERRSGAKK